MSRYIKMPQPDMGGPPTGPAVRGSQRSGAAITSLVLGAASLICFGVGPVAGIAAIIFGIVALRNIGRSEGQITGTGLAIAGICLAAVGTAIGSFSLYWFGKGVREGAPGTSSGNSAFEQAEDNIRSKRGDQIGFGNTPEAAALADSFAAQMKIFRESFFTGESKGGLSGGEFLTHCELHDEHCAFVVHVPDLRNFDDEAKESLCDLAWTVAQMALEDTDLPEGSDVGVGVRGLIFYEDVMTGTLDRDAEDPERRSFGNDPGELEIFFPAPADSDGEIPNETETESGNSGAAADSVDISGSPDEN